MVKWLKEMPSNIGFGNDSVMSLSSKLGLDFRCVLLGNGLENALLKGVSNGIK